MSNTNRSISGTLTPQTTTNIRHSSSSEEDNIALHTWSNDTVATDNYHRQDMISSEDPQTCLEQCSIYFINNSKEINEKTLADALLQVPKACKESTTMVLKSIVNTIQFIAILLREKKHYHHNRPHNGNHWTHQHTNSRHHGNTHKHNRTNCKGSLTVLRR